MEYYSLHSSPKMYFKCFIVAIFLAVFFLPDNAIAQSAGKEPTVLGVKIRFGGRYDNIRMCVASPAGAKGGIAADISFFSEFGIANDISLHIDIPIMRPILFAAAFKMLQFEPSVSLNFSKSMSEKTNFIVGPTLGLSFHYGPDYKSGSSGLDRTDSFFAMGFIVGANLGVEFIRPQKISNFELGISPFFTPLFGINDTADHKGFVAGALLNASFRFIGD